MGRGLRDRCASHKLTGLWWLSPCSPLPPPSPLHVASVLQTQLQLYAPGASLPAGVPIPRAGAGAGAQGPTTAPAAHSSVRGVVSSTWAQHGPRGFYRGLSPYLVFALPRGVFRFQTFEVVAGELRERGVDERWVSSPGGRACGGCPTAVATWLWGPMQRRRPFRRVCFCGAGASREGGSAP